jgi:hypothetical protein
LVSFVFYSLKDCPAATKAPFFLCFILDFTFYCFHAATFCSFVPVYCIPTFAVLRRCPIADMTPPARLFAQDGDGGIRAMCRWTKPRKPSKAEAASADA